MGMPRSGTSWLSQIFDSDSNTRFKLAPLFSYALKNAVNFHSSKQDWENFFQKVYNTKDDFMDQTYRKESGEYPNFDNKNTNPQFLVIKDTRYHNLIEKILKTIDGLKIIYIVRNPCGAIHSWLTTPREFPTKADPLKEWRTGQCRKTGPEEFWGFDDWKYITKLYLKLQKKYPTKIKVIQYEDLVNNSKKITEEMFKFIGLEINKQTIKFLEKSQSSHQQNEYSVFKNPSVKDKWKKQLDKRIIKEIYEDLKGTRLEQFLK